MTGAETRVRVGSLEIARVVNGLWQVAGLHGTIDRARAIGEMVDLVRAGFTTWDVADHYGPAEDFIGSLRRRLGGTPPRLEALTKWVPNVGPMTPRFVRANVEMARMRMDAERIDLLQLHWWDYRDPRYLDALAELSTLRERGLVANLGMTNCETAHLVEIASRGVPIVANQVPFSLVDRRVERAMVDACDRLGVDLLAYGTLCGGFLSDEHLGRPEPSAADLATASLRKYKATIDAWGGWSLLQALLEVLAAIGRKHDASIATVATAWVLRRPRVAAVIVGRRLSIRAHRDENERLFSLRLDEDDLGRIDEVQRGARDLYDVFGDAGAEFRRAS